MASVVVGVNSFISLEEANNIIGDNYISTSDTAVWWSGLSDSDKAVCLISATNIINSEQWFWIGKRVDENQSLVFPRLDVENNKEYDINDTFKLGIIKLMINNNETSLNDMYKLIKSGITSFSDGGGMSVKFGDDVVKKSSLKSSSDVIPDDIFRTYFIEYSNMDL